MGFSEVRAIDSRIKTLALIHVAGSGILLVAGVCLVAGAAMDPTYSRTVLPFVSWLFLLIAGVLLIPSFAGGLGLLRGKEWGRILVVLVSVELLLAVPVGTVLGIFGIWALRRSRSVTAAAVPPPATPAIKQHQRDLLLAMGWVAAGFLIVIGGGFLIFGGDEGLGISPVSMIGAGALIAGASVAVHRQGRAAQPPAPAPLPVVSVPAPVAICGHLEAVESTMRAAGVAIRTLSASNVQAKCRIHPKAFERRFGPLTYTEYFQPERYEEDNPTASIGCGQCGSGIFTLHPLECSLETPWFPVAPPPLILIAAPAPATRADMTAIAVSPSGRVVAVASGSRDNAPECVLWDTARREPLRRFSLTGVVRALVWSADERILIAGRGVPWPGGSGSRGASVFVHDADTGAELQRFGDDLFGLRGMALSPDGGKLLLSAMNGETRADGSSLELWDLTSGRRSSWVARVAGSAHERLPYFTAVAFTPDGSLILAGCDRYIPPSEKWRSGAEPPWWWSRGIRTWIANDHQELDFLRHHSPVRRLCVTADGSRMFTAGDRLGVWSLVDGKKSWDFGSYTECAAAASPDGRLVARGVGHAEDNQGLVYAGAATEIYDGETGEFISLGTHHTPPADLAFLPQGGLVAGGAGGELRFWDLPG